MLVHCRRLLVPTGQTQWVGSLSGVWGSACVLQLETASGLPERKAASENAIPVATSSSN